MGNPRGNPGNKGGGRKSAYQEKADAELLWRMFMGELSKDELLQKLKTGKYSLKDVFVTKAFQGNERFLSDMFRKLFPDIVEQKEEVSLKIDV
jgi:hypothetical protein